MKKIIYSLSIMTILVGAFAFTTIRRYTDIFQQLAISNNEAKETIFLNFEQGSLSFPHSSVLTKLAIGKREAAVKEIGDYMKAYTASPEFAEQYKAAREAAKPQGVTGSDEKRKARMEELEHDIESTQSDMKSKTGDMRKLYEVTLAELTKELKALKDPSDPLHQQYVKKASKVSEMESNTAAEDLKYWQEEYPPAVKELVKKRLTAFLAFTSDINFNAKLEKRGSKMVFADPALEEKDATWKYCFRSGKETITAARQYAQQWLATLK
jgi:hypothetical protein